jgi:hypothetical protein
VGRDFEIHQNEVLCQDSVDDLVTACTVGGAVYVFDNNGTCP